MSEPASQICAFISHASADRAPAEEICRGLEARGCRCWIAPRDIRGGREYGDEIIQGIEGAKAMVLVLTDAANESVFVRREIERAVSKRKRVFPIRMQQILPAAGLELFISNTHWIDAWAGRLDDHLGFLARELSGDDAAPTRTAIARAAPVRRKRRFLLGVGTIVLLAAIVATAWALLRKSDTTPALPDEFAVFASVPAAPPQTGQPWTNSLGMRFVPVPGAGVLFCACNTRVHDFETFVTETGYDATGHVFSMAKDGWGQRGDTWKSPGFEQGPTHPVCGVNFNDAIAFCNWITERERGRGYLLAGQSYRLPTDAEWSIAVGLPPETGNSPKDKHKKIPGVYPWGTRWPPPPKAGNYAGSEAWDDGNAPPEATLEGYRDNFRRTSPPGRFPPNRYGLYDLGGNVWEWTMDDFDPDAADKTKTLRGASWATGRQEQVLSSYRHNAHPDSRYTGGGFRCVLVLTQPTTNETQH